MFESYRLSGQPSIIVAHDTQIENRESPPVEQQEVVAGDPVLALPTVAGALPMSPMTGFIEACAEDAKTASFKSCKNFRNKSAYGACVAAQASAAEQLKMLSDVNVAGVMAVPTRRVLGSPPTFDQTVLEAGYIPDQIVSQALEAGYQTCAMTIAGAQKSEGWADNTVRDHITDCRRAVPRAIATAEKCLMRGFSGRSRSFGGLRTVTGAPYVRGGGERRRVVHRTIHRPSF